MTTETTNNKTVVNVAKSEKQSFTNKVKEVENIGGYVSGKYASQFLSEKSGRDFPVTSVNNLAYAGKIEAVKIAGVFLFLLEGDNSLTAYLPKLDEKKEAAKNREKQNAIKVQQKAAKDLFNKYIQEAIAAGKSPDIAALAKELGIN